MRTSPSRPSQSSRHRFHVFKFLATVILRALADWPFFKRGKRKTERTLNQSQPGTLTPPHTTMVHPRRNAPPFPPFIAPFLLPRPFLFQPCIRLRPSPRPLGSAPFIGLVQLDVWRSPRKPVCAGAARSRSPRKAGLGGGSQIIRTLVCDPAGGLGAACTPPPPTRAPLPSQGGPNRPDGKTRSFPFWPRWVVTAVPHCLQGGLTEGVATKSGRGARCAVRSNRTPRAAPAED